MIATKCPACGAEGRVPNTKINTRLVCPKCLKIFHVTSAGRSAIGEPPTPSAAATPKATAGHPSDQTQKVEEMLPGIFPRSLFTRKSLIVASVLLRCGADCRVLLAPQGRDARGPRGEGHPSRRAGGPSDAPQPLARREPPRTRSRGTTRSGPSATR